MSQSFELSDKYMEKLQKEVNNRRKMCGMVSHTYCTTCFKTDAKYVSSDVMTGRTECEECYIKRRANELSCEMENIREWRLQTVKKYFNSRKLNEIPQDLSLPISCTLAETPQKDSFLDSILKDLDLDRSSV